MKHFLRLLFSLFTILCCTTIAGAAVQEVHAGVVFEKACILEGETSFSVEFVAANNTTRVGRWMSEAEHAAMTETNMVQQSLSGTTHVASPASPLAYQAQARTGSLYVEFDVPSASLKATQEGWAKILSPSTLEGRLAAQKGLPVPQLPPATNIQHTATKFR